jgi:glutathione S-transferase
MNPRLQTKTIATHIETPEVLDAVQSATLEAAGVIHDLGNLIQIASSAVSIIARSPEMPAIHAAPMLSRARASLDQAGVIVRQRLGHISQQATAPSVVSVEDCLRKISLLIGDLFSSDFMLDIGIEADLPRVECDPLGLQNAILNLIINARDAMEAIGTVRIVARRTTDGPVAPAIEIIIADDGPGMTPDTIARAFTPFFTTKLTGHGGVGLPMVKRFVEGAGGEIVINSVLEVGTTVTLNLPSALQRVGLEGISRQEMDSTETRETTAMKLYYAPGACSLACRISLHEAQLSADFERVDLKTKLTERGHDYSEVNPKGYVPLLVLDSGDAVTEAVAVLALIADREPDLGARGPLGRTRLIETLSYLSSEVHIAFKPFFHDRSEGEEIAARAIIARRLELATAQVKELYLFGSHFSVADAYLFVMMRWAKAFRVPMEQHLHAYFDRIAERPAVQISLAEEGLD